MATPKSSLIIKQWEGWGGSFVDSQYLGAAYETGKPQMLEGAITKIFSSNSRFFTGGKNLLAMTAGKGTTGTMEIESDMYRWKLQGAEQKSARIIENLESSNLTPGLNNTTFRVKLDVDWYVMPDVLLPEDNNFPLEIVEGPIPDGTGSIYVVRLQGDNPSRYLDPKYLESNREFDKVWTSIPSEFNQWYGTQQYPNAFLLESQLSYFGEKFTVTDKAWRESGRLEVEFLYTDDSGREQRVNKFLPMAEAKMWDNLYTGIEAQLVYGRKQTHAGPDKYWVKTGSYGPLCIVIYIAYSL